MPVTSGSGPYNCSIFFLLCFTLSACGGHHENAQIPVVIPAQNAPMINGSNLSGTTTAGVRSQRIFCQTDYSLTTFHPGIDSNQLAPVIHFAHDSYSIPIQYPLMLQASKSYGAVLFQTQQMSSDHLPRQIALGNIDFVYHSGSYEVLVDLPANKWFMPLNNVFNPYILPRRQFAANADWLLLPSMKKPGQYSLRTRNDPKTEVAQIPVNFEFALNPKISADAEKIIFDYYDLDKKQIEILFVSLNSNYQIEKQKVFASDKQNLFSAQQLDVNTLLWLDPQAQEFNLYNEKTDTIAKLAIPYKNLTPYIAAQADSEGLNHIVVADQNNFYIGILQNQQFTIQQTIKFYKGFVSERLRGIFLDENLQIYALFMDKDGAPLLYTIAMENFQRLGMSTCAYPTIMGEMSE